MHIDDALKYSLHVKLRNIYSGNLYVILNYVILLHNINDNNYY